MIFFLLGGFDLVILVDGSSSVGGAANFKIVMQFVKSIYHSFLTGHRVRFALVIFGGGSVKVKNYSLLTLLEGTWLNCATCQHLSLIKLVCNV